MLSPVETWVVPGCAKALKLGLTPSTTVAYRPYTALTRNILSLSLRHSTKCAILIHCATVVLGGQGTHHQAHGLTGGADEGGGGCKIGFRLGPPVDDQGKVDPAL